MSVYYNEFDPFAAQWLRNLIAAGHLPAGDVDERSIVDVNPSDLEGYTQCHFFAGIGGWPYALRLAGWPDDRAVWTGSCPCQPLSSAGLRKGHADERHLWPAFYRLISECAPPVVFGEQVASKDGREWLAGVRADLEALGYALGGADLPAASVGSPQIRYRLWWVANALRNGVGPNTRGGTGSQAKAVRVNGRLPRAGAAARLGGSSHILADTAGERRGEAGEHRGRPTQWIGDGREPYGLGNARFSATGGVCGPDESAQEACQPRPSSEPAGSNPSDLLGDPESAGPQRQRRLDRAGSGGDGGLARPSVQVGVPRWNGPAVAVECTDGSRRISAEPSAFPLVDGVSGRVVIRRAVRQGATEVQEEHQYARTGALKGAGNAIVPQVGAEFVMAYMEATTPTPTRTAPANEESPHDSQAAQAAPTPRSTS